MPVSTAFWAFFNQEAAPRLALREQTFRKTFEYLDQISHPLVIVETGCARLAGNWQGDGQSTVLFDRYVSSRDQASAVYSVDIDATSVAEGRKLVGDRVQLAQADSVRFLSELTNRLVGEGRTIDLLYLDSFDVDWIYWYPSAVHHLKELCAATRALRKETLVVVDDCPLDGPFVWGPQNQVQFLANPAVGGKGRLVAEYAAAAGAKLEFAGYQTGWTGF